MYSNDDGGAFALAVRAWCARHPLPRKTHVRKCPVCSGAGCFAPMGGDSVPPRWACFDSSHTGAGLPGNGCHTGDALDLEAFRRGVTRAEVLRQDGALAARDTAAAAKRPVTTKAARMAEHWGALDRGGGALDLVRLTADGVPCVRCYGARGFPAGVRRLDALPSGWIGATLAGAALLSARGAGARPPVCVEPSAVVALLAELSAADTVLVCLALDLAELDPALPLLVPRGALDRWRAAWPLRDVRPWPVAPLSPDGAPEVLAALDRRPVAPPAVRRLSPMPPVPTVDVVRHEGDSHD